MVVRRRPKPLLIFLVIMGSLLILLAAVYLFLASPVDKNSHEKIEIVVPSGTGVTGIAKILKENNLIRSEVLFTITVKSKGNLYLQASTYLFRQDMSMEDIISELISGSKYNPDVITITFKEGMRITDYAKDIAKATNHSETEVLNTLNDRNFLDNLRQKYWFLTDSIFQDGIYYPLEGYLAPETYFLTQETTNIESITKMMLDQTEKHLEKYKKQLQSFQIGQKTLTIHEMMTLSSIVQRESPSNSEDRRLIAGVLINRLNKPMRLQSDVTVNYGNQVTKVDVNYQDLNKDTLYNTYRHDVLPVGPISSVSTHVIQDVLNYKTSDYYYFFATKEQKVLYAKTFEKHQENVSKNKWY